jgi:hypothetical protein
VTADNKSKILGALLPPFTASYSGFKNGETLATSGVTGSPSLTTTATSASPVGSYTITAAIGGLAAVNYSFAFANGTLSIVYGFDGFLQPINDTAHELVCAAPCPVSVFKAGSTIPVKFQIKAANGTVVWAAVAPTFVGPVKGGTINLPIDESVYTDPPTPGSSYAANGNQYQYNWSTKGLQAGYYYRIGGQLEDGTTQYVYIALK